MSEGGRRAGLDEEVTGGVHFEVVSTPVGAGAVNIFVICLDREGGEHNIIDRPFATGLARAVVQADRLASRGLVDMVVLCSAKRGSFVAGADIKHQLLMIGEEGRLRCVALQHRVPLGLVSVVAVPSGVCLIFYLTQKKFQSATALAQSNSKAHGKNY